MLGVGARQRGQHPRGRPGGELALAHRREHRLGQTTDQFQAAADPTDIAPTAPGDLALGKALAVDQLAQQQGFLDGGKGPPVAAGEHRKQGLGQIAVPGFDGGGVMPEPAQGGDAPIAVDHHQALAAVLDYGDAGDELARAFDRTGQLLDGSRLDQSRIGKAQVQAVQIDFPGGGFHDRDATRRRPGWL